MSPPSNDKPRSFTLEEVNEDYMMRRAALDETTQASPTSFAEQMGVHLDNPQPQPHHQNMNAPTREEIDAKLELLETRIDSRVASLEGKLDAFLARIEARFSQADGRMSRIEQSMAEVKNDSKNLKWWLAGTAVAVIIGISTANIALVQTMIASFESGKSTSAAQASIASAQASITAAQADIKKQSEETAALLRQLQQQAPPPGPAAPK